MKSASSTSYNVEATQALTLLFGGEAASHMLLMFAAGKSTYSEYGYFIVCHHVQVMHMSSWKVTLPRLDSYITSFPVLALSSSCQRIAKTEASTQYLHNSILSHSTIPHLHQHHNLYPSNMKFTLPALASLLALPSALALATPPYPTNTTTNGTITPPSRYYLQTRVKGYGNSDKNGLYVSGYHTGAGLNDATLQTIDVATAGYLNGTNQQFDLGTEFPWGMNMVDYDYYAGIISLPNHPLDEMR